MSSSNNAKTLVIDDSAPMRKAIIEALRAIPGCEVVGEGKNGLEALELARAHCPDLIVMDIHMPVMGGFEALRLLKRELPCIQVVLVSTAVEPEIRALALNVGATACLQKGPEMFGEFKLLVAQLTKISQA